MPRSRARHTGVRVRASGERSIESFRSQNRSLSSSSSDRRVHARTAAARRSGRRLRCKAAGSACLGHPCSANLGEGKREDARAYASRAALSLGARGESPRVCSAAELHQGVGEQPIGRLSMTLLASGRCARKLEWHLRCSARRRAAADWPPRRSRRRGWRPQRARENSLSAQRPSARRHGPDAAWATPAARRAPRRRPAAARIAALGSPDTAAWSARARRGRQRAPPAPGRWCAAASAAWSRPRPAIREEKQDDRSDPRAGAPGRAAPGRGIRKAWRRHWATRHAPRARGDSDALAGGAQSPPAASARSAATWSRASKPSHSSRLSASRAPSRCHRSRRRAADRRGRRRACRPRE